MTPADRAALAARLRAEAGMLLSSVSVRAECGLPVISARKHADDLLAAAAELERPRRRIKWSVHKSTGHVDATMKPFGVIWHGNARDRSLLAKRRDSWIALGFDVDPLPEVSDAR